MPDLYVKLIGGGEPILVARRAESPAWSPDGREIAFLRHLEKPGENYDLVVFTVPALGGHERQLAALGNSDRGLSYSPDGKLLAMSNHERPDSRPEIWLLSTETGAKRCLTRFPSGHVGGDYQPRFSPDGRTVAFVRAKTASSTRRGS
jgi:Tol biopolymer transport system component